ncbi:baculoviral IAP repeat-containing protein 7-B-like [Gigantopelta aegis]|uniref:baculoviral IAP repeat-containing protein 7-B-like n=1 Tax=Gigantopelta aegis TaxID=1735272 RepID=UPI001B88AA0F|nr:baculoviral IAP repeat-containing protein 7-B-like [Gigantopelta aegis]XP_041352485.1 baculoviral IAP repeat-containing protein 7-B-like [Gigantopelta aegis]XP_041352486.1 baculoviral IAP repeat-containing protein 7-B-like [Gigantopelta aegis]XP_041352487.1 baculoviral IAP repeat-containing protein 7-B-like [Gigantopelta aegis]XP_041352488.1 baculoviral IAP repeat-containing protein 7-B-like [Gigantopelta aegis]XP_041352489.1 baculoviral IAP repeat-containing protein 7-B-like [Gigantopelta 
MNPLPEQQQLKSEAIRLETFRRWPLSASQSPETLAKNGFYYIGPSDRVRCAFCSGVLKSWRPSDDPCREHEVHFPKCPFVRNLDVGNIPISPGSRPASIVVSQVQPGRAVPILNLPKYSQFADKNARLKSLEELPSNVPQDRDLLATAGFFYAGHGDSVRCFCCGGTLRSWERSDDPWIEHAVWFPRCTYVIQEKGEQFVREIQSNFLSSIPNRQAIQSPQRESPQPLRRHPSANSRQLMPCIQAVIEMGYNEELVQQVLLNQMRQGNNITSAESLLSAVEEHVNSSPNSPVNNVRSLTNIVAATNLEDPIGGLEDRIMCKICMAKEVEVTFLPCGHLVCCEECSKLVTHCPVCRKSIRGTIRTYLA